MAKLAQLTLAGNTNKWVYINPNHVIAVTPGSGHTRIDVSGNGIRFFSPSYKVKETVDVVMQRLNSTGTK
ncbi:hypothetical protein [Agrobacterium tumefaciens]|uniref:hypothetical protein n=1 Tax=Agrobacterium tumefaciens TaxID=358 RepID=UPI003BA21ED2